MEFDHDSYDDSHKSSQASESLFKSALSAGGNDHNSTNASITERISVHYFHMLPEQSCCCCIPLGMALHIVGVLDIIAIALLILTSIDGDR